MEVVGWTLLGILVGVLALVLLILCLPLRVKAEYLERFHLRVYLFGCIPVYTLKDRPEKEDETAKKPEKGETTASPKKDKLSFKDEMKALKKREGVGGVIDFFKRMLSIATDALKRVVRSITVRRLSLCIRVGGDEADAVAKSYGTISATVAATLTALSGVMRIRRKRVLIQPDFLADTTTVRMRMVLWVWPLGVLAAAIAALFRFIFAWSSVTSAPTKDATTIKTKKTTSQ